MYEVSLAYEQAVKSNRRKSTMHGTLTVGKKEIALGDNDIIKNTVYVTNQCVNGSDFELGCTYAGECGLTIKSGVDRYKLYDCELKLYYDLEVSNGKYETVPLGVFYISEANRINDKISIKALDGMTKLDKSVKNDTTGTLKELLELIADKCHVELADIDYLTFPNSDVLYKVEADKIDSYRDLLAYLCQMSACFAQMDRYGRLKLVKFDKQSSIDLGKSNRFTNASFSDYTTQYSGVTARFIAEENYAPYDAGSSDGLVLDLGDNPLVRGTAKTKHEVLENVWNVVSRLDYEPCEIEIPGNPAIDLGDYLINDYVGSDNQYFRSYVTYTYWTYRGKHKLKSVGGNPKLANVKDKQSKQLSSTESQINAKSIQVKSYINADDISFSNSETEIAQLSYSATESSKILFLMTVRLKLSLDGVIELKFYTDAAPDAERVFRKYLDRGEHFLTISELYVADENDRHTISVKAHMEYFESDSRKQDADITTCKNFLQAIETAGATVSNNVVVFPAYQKGTIDKTVPICKIEKYGVKAILYGQGISTAGKWDGAINIAETFTPFSDFGGAPLAKLTGEYTKKLYDPLKSLFNEVLNLGFSGQIAVADLTEQTYTDEIIHDYRFDTNSAYLYAYDKYVSTNNDIFALKSIYTYESVEEPIDSGKMSAVSIDYTGLDVESVVVK